MANEKKIEERKYRVTKGVVGAWSLADKSVFSDVEFARLHPIPDTEIARATIEKETYHDDLLGRLLVLGVIEQVPSDTPTTLTQFGPGASPSSSTKNLGIRQSIMEVEKQREQEKLSALPVAPLNSLQRA